ncbi:hypothetical protein NITLEN_10563 [Nitrospira lenta]|uniref:Bacterial bifunctional deaminase-reductase C-terminal domain-containing protein n=1 Tax=Nitrospira lenta TaxID=1436998 RepID=A0A330L2C9_9BACT|nr:hypothetical protein [Nitrospira lenta]SPP63477.1 hypothetical protein NITLEN_10563 [Nitrospira lenta]
MKTQYYTATSLDGFIATEDDSLEWLFPLGDLNDSSYPRKTKVSGTIVRTDGWGFWQALVPDTGIHFLASQYLSAWIIARFEGEEAARSALHYVAPVGEKEEYVDRAMKNITPYLTTVAA